MPRFKHLVEVNYSPTFRTEKVAGMFDVSPEKKLKKEWDINLPIEDFEWEIGLIIGASGSGKTSIAKAVFGESAYFSGHEWKSKSILDDFSNSLSVSDITNALSHVGFSSPPAWLLPYAALSNGQKFRTDLARALLERNDVIVFDEFTSLVDRTVAKVASYAVSKLIRKNKKKFVGVSCHYDIAEWLEPDWVYDVSEMEFYRGRLRRPEIKIKIKQVHHTAWRLFVGHHYLNANINKAAKVYVAFIEDYPVAICAILPFPHPQAKNTWREHRTVVLPDFQGVGIGNKLSEAIGDLLLSEGKRFISTTSHPSMIHHRAKSKLWKMTRPPSRARDPNPDSKISTASGSSVNRLTASFEYIGNK